MTDLNQVLKPDRNCDIFANDLKIWMKEKCFGVYSEEDGRNIYVDEIYIGGLGGLKKFTFDEAIEKFINTESPKLFDLKRSIEHFIVESQLFDMEETITDTIGNYEKDN